MLGELKFEYVEIVKFWFPIGISIFSLLIAYLAYRHTKRSAELARQEARNIAEEHFRLTSKHIKLLENMAFNDMSKKYVPLLSQVNNEFEDISSKLSDVARRASTDIGQVLDQFDTKHRELPRLSHSFELILDIVKNAYDVQLTNKSGSYLMSQLRRLKMVKHRMDTNLEPPSMWSIFKSFFKSSNDPQTPAQIIDESWEFWIKIESIYDRVPSSKEPELFNKTMKVLEEYSSLHREMRPRLDALNKQLEDAIKENNLETIKLIDIPNLGQNLKKVKGDILVFRELHFPDFNELENHPVCDGIAYSIFAGCVVYIASQHFMWGKSF